VETLRDLDLVRAQPASFEFRADDDGDTLGTMVVRFSPFDTWYRVDSWFEGTFLERTVKGAFKKTMRENRDNIVSLFDHGFDFSIGEKILGTVDELKEAKDSAVGEVALFDTSYNRDLLPGLRAGVYGSSFKFRVVKEEWDDEPAKSAHNPDGLPERSIKEVRLFEFGPVTFPANPAATSGMRSATDAYYEHLRTRDPRRYDELVARARSIRTPDAPAGSTTGDDGAAPQHTDEPAPATRGLSPSARERLLALPFLALKETA
jgi:HK97 family phage prohead protease